jgi:paxillin
MTTIVSGVVCANCNEAISGIALFAFEMHWHPYCLACNTCGRDFTDGLSAEEGPDGLAYCTKDFHAKFSDKCASCNQVILGQMLTALDKKWHPDHFVCGTCKEPLPGTFFPGPNGNFTWFSSIEMPYCEKHYYELMGLLCPECEKPIIGGKAVSFAEKKYHPEHFRCAYCKKNLVGEAYLKQNGKPYCKKCHVSLFG